MQDENRTLRDEMETSKERTEEGIKLIKVLHCLCLTCHIILKSYQMLGLLHGEEYHNLFSIVCRKKIYTVASLRLYFVIRDVDVCVTGLA